MKYDKKVFSIISALLLIIFFTACSGDSTNSKGEVKEDNSNLNETGFPIVDEPIELTFFTGKSPDNRENFEEATIWKEYAEKTNVDVNFDLVPFESLGEKKNLVLASGDYPDAFYSARLSSSDLAKYGEQGSLIELNDLIDDYAPNLKKLMEEDPNLRKGLSMPDGKIYSFPLYYDPEFISSLIASPLWVNQEWLDKLDMEEPETTEEFYNYLKAVKETDLTGDGKDDQIPFSGRNIWPLLNHLKGAWGLGTTGLFHRYIDVDPETEELRFFRTDPKYKEVLEYTHKLYDEGLIDPEVFDISVAELHSKGSEGILGSTIVPNPETSMNQENYVGLGALKGPHGDQLYSHVQSPLLHLGAFAITDKNEHPEATIRWIDHFYGEEGAKLYFMGVEGVTYEENSDGKLEYKDDITDNPEGLTLLQALAEHITWLGGSHPGYGREEYIVGDTELQNTKDVKEKAEPYIMEEIWYNFNYTDEELKFKQSIGAEIENYVAEHEAGFVVGKIPFSEWDNYVDELEKMGVDKYIETENEAYKRYKDQ